MADDERAAKAARAKAMLKKRQQKKVAVGTEVASPITPARALSPAPSLPASSEDHPNEFGQLATNHLKSLVEQHHTPAPPAPPAPPPEAIQPEVIEQQESRKGAVPHSPNNYAHELKILSSQIEAQKQTISLLVSEKNTITSALERLEGTDVELDAARKSLQAEQAKSEQLETQYAQAQAQLKKSASGAQSLESENATLKGKLFDQDRELQHARANAGELKGQLTQTQRHVSELEERIQNDDSVERLEASLQNVRSRADELEFQLSKSKQANSELKAENDKMRAELASKTDSETNLGSTVVDLQKEVEGQRSQLATLSAEKTRLQTSNADYASKLESSQRSLSTLQQKLTQVASDLAISNRQLEAVQNESRIALRRAEEAERVQGELQNEGTSLMRSVEEMRPKIVELNSAKLDLTERANDLTQTIHRKENVISQLEADLEQSQQVQEESTQRILELEKTRAEEQERADADLSELQKAYAELQEQLDDALSSVRELDGERARGRQSAVQQQEEAQRLIHRNQELEEQLNLLQQQVSERSKALDDQEAVLRDTQTEVEALRTEIASKEEELAELQAGDVLPSRPSTSTVQSLDGEMISALKQQHTIELSKAQSEIRELQTSLHESESIVMIFRKQISLLEDQLAELHLQQQQQQQQGPHRSFSPVQNGSSVRSSLDQSRVHDSGARARAIRSTIDDHLPAATRHQRRISLGMLKARMLSETAQSPQHHHSSRSLTGIATPAESTSTGSSSNHNAKLATLHERSDSTGSNANANLTLTRLKRPQFLDESHVFWCASCKGDLIIL